MTHEVFTAAWVSAWAHELRSSEAYKKAAATWEGSILLRMTADPEHGVPDDREVFLDLWLGDCRAGRLPKDGDRDGAAYIIEGSAAGWRRVLGGELEPILGLMSGKLKLRRGSLARLTPYLTASKELVAAATRIGSHFPTND